MDNWERKYGELWDEAEELRFRLSRVRALVHDIDWTEVPVVSAEALKKALDDPY